MGFKIMSASTNNKISLIFSISRVIIVKKVGVITSKVILKTKRRFKASITVEELVPFKEHANSVIYNDLSYATAAHVINEGHTMNFDQARIIDHCNNYNQLQIKS